MENAKMWKLKNKLFGWDYIFWKNYADHGIARVIELKDGTIGYWRYRITNVFDKINNSEQVIWLTCHPTKYFKKEEDFIKIIDSLKLKLK